MPASTPKYGFPYPTGTDRVMDGDNAIGALAAAVEDVIAGLIADERIAAPSDVTITNTATEVPATRYTVTTTRREIWWILGIWDFYVSTVAAGNSVRGTLAASPELGTLNQFAQQDMNNIARSSGSMAHVTPPLAPGTYFVAQRVHKTTTGGVAICSALNTRLSVIRIPAPV